MGLIRISSVKRRRSKIYYPFILLFVVILGGIAGFMMLEGYSFFDAAYMTVITISTVGFSEVEELSKPGRAFTMGLILTSFGTFAFAISEITRFVVDGELEQYLYHRRVLHKIAKMSDHTIVCGYGRNGRQAVRTLREYGEKVVLIESNPDRQPASDSDGAVLHIIGNATHDQVLLDAGVKRAKAMISTLPKDADNLFVTLSARVLNPKMKIISRASEENSDSKLRHAGVNNVIMPDKVGGAHMAQLVMKPDVVEFMDQLTGQASVKEHLEEIDSNELPEEYMEKTIADLNIRARFGANIIGFKGADGKYQFNPPANAKLARDTKLFVLGTSDQIKDMKLSLRA